MKAKITRSDGSILELDGTAQEISEVVDRLQKPAIPPSVPSPGSSESLKKLLDDLKRQQSPNPHDQIYGPLYPPYVNPCPSCDGGPWWAVTPPPCTCGKRLTPYVTPGKITSGSGIEVSGTTSSGLLKIGSVTFDGNFSSDNVSTNPVKEELGSGFGAYIDDPEDLPF